MKRISNYHSHLALCGHATGDVIDYVKEAIKHNYEEIGISDHAPIPEFFVGKEKHHSLYLDRMMTRDEFFNDYLVQLDDAIEKYGDKIHILKGLEIEYVPNHDPFYQKLYSYLDYLNLGVHYFPYKGTFSSVYDPLNEEEMESYCDTAIEGLSKGWFNCLVHPDIYLYHVKEFKEFHEKIARRLIEAAIKYDVYLEVNGNGKDKYPRWEFFEIAKQYKDVKILINSDCHCVENFHGDNIKRVMKFSEDLGLNISLKMDLRPHQKETRYIGHRGASFEKGIVNNCKSGFLEGIKRDYYGLECDVRVTKDKVYYIHHNGAIDFSNNNFVKEDVIKKGLKENESLNNLTWDEIKDLRLYYNYLDNTSYDYLLKFEDYVKLCKESRTTLIVELKNTNGINDNDIANLDGVFEIIKKYDMMKETVIISFMAKVLEYVKKNYQVKDISLLTGEENTNMDSVKYCINNNFSLDADYHYITKEIVDEMHKHNLTVNVWTMNDKSKEDELKKMGVDFFTTDTLGR